MQREYAVARAAAVASRPLCLFLAANFGAADVAEGLAIAFLASSLGLVVAAAGPHRHYYARQFASARVETSLAFYTYVASVFLLATLGSSLVGGGVARQTGAFDLAVASALYFLSEKLGDEILRFRLYARDFAGWGRISLGRSVGQAMVIATLVLTWGDRLAASAAVGGLAVANALALAHAVPRGVVRFAWRLRSGPTRRILARAVRSLAGDWQVWGVTLVSASVGYVDRVAALLHDREVLALFTMVVMCFSAVVMLSDFFYLSRHSRDFLEQRVLVWKALLGPSLWSVIAAGLVVGLGGTTCVLYITAGGASFPWAYAVGVAALQVALTLAQVPHQILYWRGRMTAILCIEGAFWGLAGSGALVSRAMGAGLSGTLAILAGCAVVRVAMYGFVAARR